MEKNQHMYTFKVPDMSCAHCKMRITDALEEIPGVLSVSIDLDAKKVMVETSETLTKEQLIERMNDEGYEAFEIEDQSMI
ncbi:MAG: heavy-metal-associated domain-containing protein [Candidatus Omnitrophota bacterium]